MAVAGPTWLQTALQANAQEAPPGHRFRMYLDGWNDRFGMDNAKEELKSSLHRLAGAGGNWTEMRAKVRARESGLINGLASIDPGGIHVVHGKSTAPFLTGVGNEHPLENGMAFLDPYGLPGLPGSSVKGTLRRAAEELALFEDRSGWTPLRVWRLFGFDGSSTFLNPPRTGKHASAREDEAREWREAFDRWLGSLDASSVTDVLSFLKVSTSARSGGLEDLGQALTRKDVAGARVRIQGFRDEVHIRGELEFWDVVPEPERASSSGLKADVFTPHFPEYYGKDKPPSDDQGPQPLSLLVLDPDQRFRFTVTHRRWLPALAPVTDWKPLLDAAFDHAFEWLGFGAKTSQGFGRMVRDEEASRRDEEAREKARREREAQEEARAEEKRREAELRRLEAMGPVERFIAELDVELAAHRNDPRRDPSSLAGFHERLMTEFSGDDQVKAATKLRELYQELKRWSKKDVSKKQFEKVKKIREILGED